MTSASEIRYLTVRSGSAWSDGHIGYTARVYGGRVYVLDPVSRSWTLCHNLTNRQMAYILEHAV